LISEKVIGIFEKLNELTLKGTLRSGGRSVGSISSTILPATLVKKVFKNFPKLKDQIPFGH
jgi:hypothetical protein